MPALDDHVGDALPLGLDEPSVELKSALAAIVALQFAWAALEEFVFAVLDVADDERDAVRTHVATTAISPPSSLD